MNGGATVFVIDRDQASRQAIGEVAESMGLGTEMFSQSGRFLEDCFGQSGGCLVTELRASQKYFLRFLEQMVNCQITLPTIVVATQPQTALTVKLMKQGAVSVLEKPVLQDTLREAICEAMWISESERRGRIQKQIVLGQIASLSENERRVLDLIVDGLANKVIARRLNVSVRTVESWRHEVFAKMKCKSVAELVRTVVSSSVLTPL